MILREQIREIWRPLYDLGYKGAEQIDAQYMALLVTQATDETQALITSLLDREITAARIDEMLVATTAHRIAGGKGMPKGHQRRMRQLQARLEQLEGSDGVSPSHTSTSKETDKGDK